MSALVGAILAAAVIAAGATTYSADQGRKASNQAADMARESAEKQAQQAEKTATQSEQATNRANQRAADPASILASAQQLAKGGSSGTMLTGQGINTKDLGLGKSSLLGS